MTKGLWLFGLSGSGKTYLSKKISKKLKKPFIIDGDEIRKLISFDLGYKKSDRIEQNNRVLGLSKIVIKNGYYPIISSVYLDPKVFIKANIRSSINFKKNSHFLSKFISSKFFVFFEILNFLMILPSSTFEITS